MAKTLASPPTPIPFLDQRAQHTRLGDRIKQMIARVIACGGYIGGPEVTRFEAELAAFSGARHAVGRANGADVIFRALAALGTDPG